MHIITTMKFRKSRDQKIERLLGVDAQYVHLGIKLGKRATAWAASREDGEIAEAYGKFVENLARDERRAQIAKVFKELPAERRFAILEQTVDDGALRDILAKEREKALKQDQRQEAIAAIKETARLHRHVDLSQIPAEMQLKISLFNDSGLLRHQAAKDPTKYLEHTKYARVLTLTSLGNSKFKLLQDRDDYQGGLARPHFDPYQVMKLGAISKPDWEFSSLVHPNDQLVAVIEGTRTTIDHAYTAYSPLKPNREYVGLISIEDTEMFGQNLA